MLKLLLVISLAWVPAVSVAEMTQEEVNMLMCMAIATQTGNYHLCAKKGTQQEVSCKGAYCNYNAAWDYLPESRQYRCRVTRGTYGGQFTYDSNCSGQSQLDNWY